MSLIRPVALYGYPLEHTYSPLMHNGGFERLGLPFVYLALPVLPAKLQDAIRGFRAMEFAGANVTIPHKEKVLPLVDVLTEDARQVKAVNTLYWKEPGVLAGDNTDIYGFRRSLIEAGIDIHGRSAVILGAGGAARAVALVLAEFQAKEICFLTRHPHAVENLIQDLSPSYPHTLWEYHLKSSAAFANVLTRSSLVVNATPVGMSPQTDKSPLSENLVSLLPDTARIYDLVYNPDPTLLMTLGAQRGLKVYGGLDMLIYQGAKSFELWTGEPSPVKDIRDLMRDKLYG